MNDLLDLLKEETGKWINCGFCEIVCQTLEPSAYDLWKGARGRIIIARELIKEEMTGKRETENWRKLPFMFRLLCMLLYIPSGREGRYYKPLPRKIITTKTWKLIRTLLLK
ncbi:MAG: hypothetical protein QXQ46_11180 [Thermoplasmatales archaeon]